MAELRAIDEWDAYDLRKNPFANYETIARKARQERRTEVLARLRCLIQQLEAEGPSVEAVKS